MGLKVGLYFDLRNPPPWRRRPSDVYRRALEIAADADRRGVGGLWFSEHHLFEDGYLPQPLTFAAAAAARTSRARIGTAVVIPAFRSGPLLAEEAAVVDIISDGRLELGLGGGYRRPEFELFGADIARRYGTTDCAVHELRRAWTERHLTPTPVQDPLPLWLGYGGPRSARRAGQLATGLLSLNPPAIDAYLASYSTDKAVPAPRVGGLVNIMVCDDPEAAWPHVRAHLSWQWDTYNRAWAEGTGRAVPAPIDPEAWRRAGPHGEPRFDVVDVDGAVARLRSVTECGPVTDVFLWADIAGMPEQLVERQVELVCDQVIPLLDADEPSRDRAAW
jgi:alkanesulfonate monooxygenase SsuD/methylene tetrahydromethanopterin reductase-like flavin-dependent oxidoreductase (luciferase family)